MKNSWIALSVVALALIVAVGCSSPVQGGPDKSQNLAISAKLLTGNGPPTPSSGGSAGDLYLDQTGASLYVLQSTGWTNVATLKGPAGAAGSAGATGPAGSAGAAGADGHTWYTGTTAPAAALGSNGDFYLNTTSAEVYAKSSGAWTLSVSLRGQNGSNGTNGNSWLSGSGMPGAALGNAGDLYLDSLNAIVYSKTGATTWVSLFSFPLARAQLVYARFEEYLSPNSLCYGDGVFVLVGLAENGISTSKDGAVWSKSLPMPWPPNAVAFGNHTFVVVTSLGTIHYSSNPAESWQTAGYSSGERSLNAVTYGNGMFVAVGNSGIIVTSPDGINWTQQANTSETSLLAVAYGNGSYVAVGGASLILTSSDAVTWETQESSVFLGETLTGIAYGNGTFVVVGDYSTLGTSADGKSWTAQTLFALGFSSVVYSGAGSGGFVALGDSTILTSPSGKAWEAQYWDSLAWDGYGFRCAAAGEGMVLIIAIPTGT
jgi:hypothetical protein